MWLRRRRIPYIALVNLHTIGTGIIQAFMESHSDQHAAVDSNHLPFNTSGDRHDVKIFANGSSRQMRFKIGTKDKQERHSPPLSVFIFYPF